MSSSREIPAHEALSGPATSLLAMALLVALLVEMVVRAT